jgi:hypothetical protein
VVDERRGTEMRSLPLRKTQLRGLGIAKTNGGSGCVQDIDEIVLGIFYLGWGSVVVLLENWEICRFFRENNSR